MKDLIEALTIFLRYRDERRPTHCEHDVLQVHGVTRNEVTLADRERLDALGFCWVGNEDGAAFDSDDRGWVSYRFGKC